MVTPKGHAWIAQATDRNQGNERRRMLVGTLAFGLAAPLLGRTPEAATDPRNQRPQPGDRLVYAYGDDQGKLVKPDDLPLGGPQELVFPVDPSTETVRDGTRLNQVAVLRLDPDALSQETASNAAEGIVAYSAVCTHQGCPISMWEDDNDNLFCSCHASQFDPRRNAEVIDGPAPRRLAILPLKMEGGDIVVAGEFQGKVGFKR